MKATVSKSQIKKGHLWLTLTDGKASVDAVAWSSTIKSLKFLPKQDDGVTIVGKLNFWESQARISVQVFDIRASMSTVLKKFEIVKLKLLKEGLIDDSLRKKLYNSTIKACKAVNYLGAGTIEYLVDEDLNYYFMEMNTRIQVEHPVTEMVLGLDLIKSQILCHNEIPLPDWVKDIKLRGHAIECRINAEDPSKSFMPSPGEITSFHMPGGNGIRVDTHAYAGYYVPQYYDSMIAKLIVHAPTRQEAISRMLGALNECVIEGIETTIPFLKDILLDPKFSKGSIHTGFIDEMMNK